MNQTLEVIEKRRSVRAYSDQLLSEAEKNAILHAAFRAPTAGNMMLYSIIDVQDQSLKDRLAQTCDHQPFIAKAPFLLLFLADYQRWFDSYTLSGVEKRCQELNRPYRSPQVGDLMLACCDALIAAQTAVIAAESLGIGSCYIGDILEQYEVHRELFSLPRYVLPVMLVCFGRPAVEREGRSLTSRYDRKFIVHENTYRRLSVEDLEEMERPVLERSYPTRKFSEGAENMAQDNYLRKFSADFSLEMSRSVAEMLKNWMVP